MEGEPLSYAKAALGAGLASLRPGDQFAVVAFDHEQLWWTGGWCSARLKGVLRGPASAASLAFRQV
jgi:hypothetical protein